jgi:hypothetical protein
METAPKCADSHIFQGVSHPVDNHLRNTPPARHAMERYSFGKTSSCRIQPNGPTGYWHKAKTQHDFAGDAGSVSKRIPQLCCACYSIAQLRSVRTAPEIK